MAVPFRDIGERELAAMGVHRTTYTSPFSVPLDTPGGNWDSVAPLAIGNTPRSVRTGSLDPDWSHLASWEHQQTEDPDDAIHSQLFELRCDDEQQNEIEARSVRFVLRGGDLDASVLYGHGPYIDTRCALCSLDSMVPVSCSHMGRKEFFRRWAEYARGEPNALSWGQLLDYTKRMLPSVINVLPEDNGRNRDPSLIDQTSYIALVAASKGLYKDLVHFYRSHIKPRNTLTSNAHFEENAFQGAVYCSYISGHKKEAFECIRDLAPSEKFRRTACLLLMHACTEEDDTETFEKLHALEKQKGGFYGKQEYMQVFVNDQDLLYRAMLYGRRVMAWRLLKRYPLALFCPAVDGHCTVIEMAARADIDWFVSMALSRDVQYPAPELTPAYLALRELALRSLRVCLDKDPLVLHRLCSANPLAFRNVRSLIGRAPPEVIDVLFTEKCFCVQRDPETHQVYPPLPNPVVSLEKRMRGISTRTCKTMLRVFKKHDCLHFISWYRVLLSRMRHAEFGRGISYLVSKVDMSQITDEEAIEAISIAVIQRGVSHVRFVIEKIVKSRSDPSYVVLGCCRVIGLPALLCMVAASTSAYLQQVVFSSVPDAAITEPEKRWEGIVAYEGSTTTLPPSLLVTLLYADPKFRNKFFLDSNYIRTRLFERARRPDVAAMIMDNTEHILCSFHERATGGTRDDYRKCPGCVHMTSVFRGTLNKDVVLHCRETGFIQSVYESSRDHVPNGAKFPWSFDHMFVPQNMGHSWRQRNSFVVEETLEDHTSLPSGVVALCADYLAILPPDMCSAEKERVPMRTWASQHRIRVGTAREFAKQWVEDVGDGLEVPAGSSEPPGSERRGVKRKRATCGTF